MKKINFNMSDDEYELLVEAMCAEEETNTSNFISKAINEYINNHFDISYE